MNDKFFDLKQEKQNRIINAALSVFAADDYRHASTDDVVRKAGISKGLLFHYFESKLGLYTFLFDYSVRFMLLEYSHEVRRSETDFFELVRQMERAKMQVMKLYPSMQQFINRGMADPSPEAASAAGLMRQSYREQLESYFLQADYSVYSRIGDSARLIRLVRYMIRGVTEEMTQRYDFTPEKLYGEVSGYIDMLQRAWQGGRE